MKDAMKILCKVCLSVAFFLTPLSALAQAQISGQVVDKTGETVIGATIVEKGNPKNATVTDFDGNFKIKVANGKTLIISYVGMKTLEIAADRRTCKLSLKKTMHPSKRLWLWVTPVKPVKTLQVRWDQYLVQN